MPASDQTEALPPPAAPRGALALLLYQLVFLLVFVVYSPVLLWRVAFERRYRGGLLQRMGLVPRTTGDRPVIWLHAVSVGELKASRQLISRLASPSAPHELVISSTTPTGRALAKELYPQLRTFYYPLDFGPFPAIALDRVQPSCVLLVELEYWPNFLFRAARRRIPVVVVNGRISERSFRGYRRIRGLLPPFGAIARFCVQDESYRRRLLDLGVDERRIFVTGNMKYDSVSLKEAPAASAVLRGWLSPDGRPVLVCGSTHGDEEARLLGAVRQLGRRLRVVLAPRHPERAASVAELVRERGHPVVLWSQQEHARPRPVAGDAVVVVDTIGHLESFYGAADVAFVGGSLVPRGGQNMLEPAALGRAVVFGPHVANFRNDVELLLGAGAAVQVPDSAVLVRELRRLLDDDAARAELGRRATELIASNQGATERTFELLGAVLQPDRVRPRPGAAADLRPPAAETPGRAPGG